LAQPRSIQIIFLGTASQSLKSKFIRTSEPVFLDNEKDLTVRKAPFSCGIQHPGLSTDWGHSTKVLSSLSSRAIIPTRLYHASLPPLFKLLTVSIRLCTIMFVSRKCAFKPLFPIPLAVLQFSVLEFRILYHCCYVLRESCY
jgi:hypothetical protein